jgi:ribonuclease Z
VSVRELVVLGTASQVPTRTRAHHGAFLRFDDQGLLLDPGEGTQRQMTLAGVTASQITGIYLTHAHGDHCLGLPGVVQRCSLDGVTRTLPIHFPTAATPFVERLTQATSFEPVTPIELRPAEPGSAAPAGSLAVRSAALSHAIPTIGWRFTEPGGRRMLPELAAAAGVHGADRARLLADGCVRIGGRTVHLDEVSEPRPGQSVAFVMDTRACEGATDLAADVDLLIIEATFLERERALADEAGHLTAAGAARIGREAGARRVVLTHFSQRYPDLTGHLDEARRAAPDLDLVIARDLERIPLPERR